MELKQIASDEAVGDEERSNRTFMELKLQRTVAMEAVMPVLIVPLWN